MGKNAILNGVNAERLPELEDTDSTELLKNGLVVFNTMYNQQELVRYVHTIKMLQLTLGFHVTTGCVSTPENPAACIICRYFGGGNFSCRAKAVKWNLCRSNGQCALGLYARCTCA